MSQLIGCVAGQAVLLAADRRVEVRGKTISVESRRKLYPLGNSAALATSGAAVGITISHRLANLLANHSALPFMELESYVLSVFQSEYDSYLTEGAEWFSAHPDSPQLAYIMLAGRLPDGQGALRFYASEKHGEPYRLLPTANVLAAPRRLGAEAALARALASGASVEELKILLLGSLARIERLEEAVLGPFDLAILGPEGLKIETVEET